MDENGKIKIHNNNGEEKEYAVLVTLEYRNKNFIIYTDYKKDENKNIKIYSSIYNPDDENGKLEKITETEDINFIQDYVKNLEEDFKSGIKF